MKFGEKVEFDKLYCVRKNQPLIAYQTLYLFIYLPLQQNFLSQISQLLLKPGSSDFVYTLRVTTYIMVKKIKMLIFILPSFSK